ncbi:MAG: hypothetical protein HY072_05995 [Deltaproteobacteria bacterium]|nr:hypothetical protein [Deltaproteobacteria bacterium]
MNNKTGSTLDFGHRRGGFFNIVEEIKEKNFNIDLTFVNTLEKFDLVYRTLCGILYNFVPASGHPGGSISSGRIVQSLMFNSMDYDFSDPANKASDILSYAAGHKAMGLYAAWALRNECVRISYPELLPTEKEQLRLEDLLGFRKNPITETPLFKKYKAKPLDGHPTPATPFVRLATGASGVGIASSFGMAWAVLDSYGSEMATPWVHVLEGEGGMTPGRVQEALSIAGTSRLHNIVLHVDWNQASIDSNRVCRDEQAPGDYVQWNPAELLYLNDWNVISVPDGKDFLQILAAQELALKRHNDQPTGIIYSTQKGWKYGIEGRVSHGAGHAFCSDGFYAFLSEFEHTFGVKFSRFSGDKTPENIERLFYGHLITIRQVLETNKSIVTMLGKNILRSKERLAQKKRTYRKDIPRLSSIFGDSAVLPDKVPSELVLQPGQCIPLRSVLGNIANYLNKITGGAFVGASADLLESTSISLLNRGFPEGFYNAISNSGCRLLSAGGICEDAQGGFLSGISAFGNHIGVGSSYGAFIAALQHISARLHAIGQQTQMYTWGISQTPFIIVCGHAGPKTGEDGPTHADPQALQLFQENFPKGSMITLTPWDHQEIWPLMVAALKAHPAIIAPFVTRPADPVIDREKYKLPPPSAAIKGVYALRKADSSKKRSGTIVLQGNGVASVFVTDVLPVIDEKSLNLNVFYIASAELFDLLPYEEQQSIFPESYAQEAMGITEFTLPLMYRWVTSERGRKHTLYPFMKGHFLGSGQGNVVFAEAGLNGKSQLEAVLGYLIENNSTHHIG